MTTMVVQFPRFIAGEFLTHRCLSRNGASSRAIPIAKNIRAVLDNPATFVHWGKAQPGMQARVELTGWRRWLVERIWLGLRYPVCGAVWLMSKLGVAKQVANRALEPWLWAVYVVSATDWDGFFALRCHEDAQPEFRVLATTMRDAMNASVPVDLPVGGWHLPFIDAVDLEALCRDERAAALVSAGRCAGVSYARHAEFRPYEKDFALAQRLATHVPAHASPFEHQARAAAEPVRSGNITGFVQFRKELGL